MATTQSRDTDTLFNTAPQLRAQLVQLQTTLSPQMNKPAFLLCHLAQPFAKKTPKRSGSPQSNDISTSSFLKASPHPVDSAVPFSQTASHTGAHLMQSSSKADEAEDRSFRAAVARRLMLPHPAAANPADLVRTCPNKSAAGQICTKLVDVQQHHCYGCRYGGGVDRRDAAVARYLADVIHTGVPRCTSNRRCQPSLIS